MAVKSVAFTMYPVSDLERAVAFYADVLGFRKAGLESPFWVEFDVDGTTFGIGNFEQVGSPGTAQSFAVEVEDVFDYRKRLAAKGVEATEPHELQNCWISVVKDPDGNMVWLHQSKAR